MLREFHKPWPFNIPRSHLQTCLYGQPYFHERVSHDSGATLVCGLGGAAVVCEMNWEWRIILIFIK